MAWRISSLMGVCLLLTLVGGALHAQEARPRKAKTAPLRLTEDQVDVLVKQLGGAKATDREAAVKKLRAAGLAVIPEVAKVATRGNTHAKTNALEILKSHLENDDAETRIAAFNALRRLSGGSRSSTTTAAKKIVDEHDDVRAEAEAARLAAKTNADRSDKKSPTAKANSRPRPTATLDPAMKLRRDAIEQQIKDGEAAIAKLQKMDIPKQLKDQQISAVMQAMQQLRTQLQQLDGGGRKR